MNRYLRTILSIHSKTVLSLQTPFDYNCFFCHFFTILNFLKIDLHSFDVKLNFLCSIKFPISKYCLAMRTLSILIKPLPGGLHEWRHKILNLLLYPSSRFVLAMLTHIILIKFSFAYSYKIIKGFQILHLCNLTVCS